ncbi:MAG: hypothetical protein JWM28_302 [Chitinophagaceae bacterium]|nr:hypothetical protein [Chitinophagaceae bacterium]
MKAILAAMILLSHVFFITACHKSVDAPGGNPSQVATSGTWRVTLFTDSGNDETNNFAGYNFTFNGDGSLTAAKSGGITTGSWSSSSKFNIDLGPKSDNNKPLGELTHDWHIISVSSTEIKLGDDNTASNEFLTFSKN